jgi:Mrp family chromosome partitioning ATPase
MDLLAYVRILRRRWALILAVMVAGAAVGAGSALASSGGDSGRFDKATHVMFIDNLNSGESSGFTDLNQMAILVTAGDVPVRVGKKLGQDGRGLAEHVMVTTNTQTGTLSISAVATTAGESEVIANTFADQLIVSLTEKYQKRFEIRRDQVLKRVDEIQAEINGFDAQVAAGGGDLVKAQRDSLVNQYRLTYEQFQQLAAEGSPDVGLSTLEDARSVPIGTAEYNESLRLGKAGANVTQVGQPSGTDTAAVSSTSSSFSGPVSRGVLGAFLGFLFGGGLAIAADHLDRRLRSREDVEDAYGVPVLAEVPKLSRHQQEDAEVLSHTEPLSRTAEAHRGVRSALLFQHVTKGQSGPNGDRGGAAAAATAAFVAPDEPEAASSLVVLVTSAQPNEGKTTTTANLAAVFAESGASVLAVNCDFRRPTLHRYLGAENEPRRVQESDIPGVALVSGVVSDPAANPAQIIAAQRQVVATARDRFDVILLDTAPLLTTNDAIEIIPVVDLVVLVARPNVTSFDGATRTRALLERVDAPIAGVVYVGDEAVSNDEYYYYSRATAGAAAVQDAASTQDDGDAESDGDGVNGDAPVEEVVDEAGDQVDGAAVAEDESSVAWASEPAGAPDESTPPGDVNERADDAERTEEIVAVATVDDGSAAGPAKTGRRRKRKPRPSS